jgi:hypothetical protein
MVVGCCTAPAGKVNFIPELLAIVPPLASRVPEAVSPEPPAPPPPPLPPPAPQAHSRTATAASSKRARFNPKTPD